MKATDKYNIVFAYCQTDVWKIADMKHKCYYDMDDNKLRSWHQDNNIYVLYQQADRLLQVGNYIYFDMYSYREDIPLERLMVACKKNEIETLIAYFLETQQDDFNAHFSLCRKFCLPINSINKTKAKLSAEILKGRRGFYKADDRTPNNLEIEKYAGLVDKIGTDKFEANIEGLNCKFGLGGIHGAREKYIEHGKFVNIDIVSMYPSLMLQYDLLSRGANKRRYSAMYDEKIEKGTLPLKIVLNSTFGAMNEPHNPLYDPSRFRLITKFGQLYILDLIEHLFCFDLIQTNTDSVLVRLDGENINKHLPFEEVENVFADICLKWQIRTGLTMNFDRIKFICQKDVNNYIMQTDDDKIIKKGAYVKDYNTFNRQIEIVNKAICNYVLYSTPTEKTICESKNLADFSFITHASDKYEGIYLGERKLGRAASVYAGKTGEKLTKKRANRFEKVAGSPSKCTEYAGQIDHQWYIDQANKRLADYGVLGGLF